MITPKLGKIWVLCFVLLECCIKIECVFGEWAWVSGKPNLTTAEYGTKSIPDVNNFPGARVFGCSVIDSKNNYWFFGGDEIGDRMIMNDLWRYNTTGKTWTWMYGSNRTEVSTDWSTNRMGSRQGHSCCISNDDVIYVFGGTTRNGANQEYGGWCNDIWSYDINTGDWFWIAGDAGLNPEPIWGNRGVAAQSSRPGSRRFSALFLDRSQRFIWIFGGYGRVTGGSLRNFADLWKYDLSLVVFTWMAGNQTGDVSGSFGVHKQGNPNNFPGARRFPTLWIDKNDIVWIFGGLTSEASPPQFFNDLWSYDTISTNWTWQGGSQFLNGQTNYGVKGVSNESNAIGARGGFASWLAPDDSFWIYGGQGRSSNVYGFLDDVWRLKNGTWTWMAGTSSTGLQPVYDSALDSAVNTPGGRRGMANYFRNDYLYIYGGDKLMNTTRTQDLWRLNMNETLISITSNSISTGISTGIISTGITSDDISSNSITSGATTSSTTSTDITSSSTSSSIVNSEKSGNFPMLAIIPIVLVPLALIIALIVVILIKKRRGKNNLYEDTQSIPLNDATELTSVKTEKASDKIPKISNVKIVRILGSGRFGEVFLGLWNGLEVALKTLKNSEEGFDNESAILFSLRHPYVVQFLGMYTSPKGEDFIVNEYVPKGELLAYLQVNNSKLKIQDLMDMIISGLVGMSFLSEKGILHRDLAARNLLVSITNEKYSVKISDFGMSRENNQYSSSKSSAIPIRWSAPEVLKHRKFNSSTDVWSYGVVMWEILSFGDTPYGWLDNQEVHEQIPQGVRLSKPTICSDEMWQIITMCFQEDPNLRPTFNELLSQIRKINGVTSPVEVEVTNQRIEDKDKEDDYIPL